MHEHTEQPTSLHVVNDPVPPALAGRLPDDRLFPGPVLRPESRENATNMTAGTAPLAGTPPAKSVRQ